MVKKGKIAENSLKQVQNELENFQVRIHFIHSIRLLVDNLRIVVLRL